MSAPSSIASAFSLFAGNLATSATRRALVFTVVLVLVGISPVRSDAGEIGVGDFGPGAQTTTFDGLGLPGPPATNPTPLVLDGHTITTDDGLFRYLGIPLLCVENECIASNTGLGFIDIVLAAPQTRAGAFVSVAAFSGWTVRADFFDASDVLLGSVVLNSPSSVGPLFAGWEDTDGIARIRFNDVSGSSRPFVLDDLIVEDVAPPPSRPIGVDDFGPGKQTTTFDDLGLPGLPATNPTPLLIDGHTITTDDGMFRYLAIPVFCVENDCIGANTDRGFIDIVLSEPQTRAGAFVSGLFFNWTIRAEFFDASDVLLGDVVLNNPSFGPLFAGWEDAGGIARLRFTDLSGNGRISVLDNLCVELVSPPVSSKTVISFGRQAALPDDETLGGVPVNVGDLVDIDTPALVATPLATALIQTDLDAAHILPNGNVLFSSDTYSFGVGNLAIVTPGDVVEYDVPSDTYSIYFSASNFVGAGNVSAVSILPNGNLILSTKIGANLPGLGAFQDGDVVEWDGAAASLFLAEEDIFTFGANNSVDALHAVDDDTILVSPLTAGAGTIGDGLPYGDDSADLFQINRVTGEASLVLDGENLWDSGNTRQLDAAVILEVEE